MAMNLEIKKEWAEKLRSPDFKQGYTKLRDKEGNQCCLDVLNQMCSDAGIQEQPVLEGEYYYYDDPYNTSFVPGVEEIVPYRETIQITSAAAKWAGLDDVDPLVRYDNGYGYQKYHLTYLNDEIKLNGPQIADAIEKDDEL